MSSREDRLDSPRFGTKAETLAHVAPHLRAARVLPFKAIRVADWRHDPAAELGKVARQLCSRVVIVRSSAVGEDSATSSEAGRYLSVPDVPADDTSKLREAIERVIASYGPGDLGHQVLVQEQLGRVAYAGVVFTSDLDTFAPYYVVSYAEGGSTDMVTSGGAGESVTWVRFRRSPSPPPDPRLVPVLELAEELESLLGFQHLDIEFGVDEAGDVYLFQVRPMVEPPNPVGHLDASLDTCLFKIRKKVEKLGLSHPDLAGSRTFFGLMPDWNPAEMIGTKPRALALSMYKELITDSVWAYQRDNYGYRNLRGFPLLVSMLGVPYIDVRVSFNSFVPKEVDERLAHKLVDHYLDKLGSNPSDHDKVEFNVVETCYHPGLTGKLKRLLSEGFSENELDRIKFALLKVTNSIIDPRSGFYSRDRERVDELWRRHGELLQSEMSVIQKIYWMVEDCKRYGTLPFAGLARAGFIAVQFLRSFVDLGVMTREEVASWMASLDTVSTQLAGDVERLGRGELDRPGFLARYGHLRPGTYDILSLRYDEAFDQYFGGLRPGAQPERRDGYEVSPQQRRRMNQILVETGITAPVEAVLAFVKGAIEAREYGKFVFTRSLSDALSHIERLGQRFDISREELSYVDIRTVLRLYADLDHREVGQVLREDIDRNRRAHATTRALKLPALITSTADLYDFRLGAVDPNFVTFGRVTGDVVRERDLAGAALAGKIVCIRSADPGYDWLFNHKIGALVTEFGGVNSHMAIRAAQLALPAVIGCGEQSYERWSTARALEVDCAHRIVRVLE